MSLRSDSLFGVSPAAVVVLLLLDKTDGLLRGQEVPLVGLLLGSQGNGARLGHRKGGHAVLVHVGAIVDPAFGFAAAERRLLGARARLSRLERRTKRPSSP